MHFARIIHIHVGTFFFFFCLVKHLKLLYCVGPKYKLQKWEKKNFAISNYNYSMLEGSCIIHQIKKFFSIFGV